MCTKVRWRHQQRYQVKIRMKIYMNCKAFLQNSTRTNCNDFYINPFFVWNTIWIKSHSRLPPFTEMSWCGISAETILRVTWQWSHVTVQCKCRLAITRCPHENYDCSVFTCLIVNECIMSCVKLLFQEEFEDTKTGNQKFYY